MAMMVTEVRTKKRSTSRHPFAENPNGSKSICIPYFPCSPFSWFHGAPEYPNSTCKSIFFTLWRRELELVCWGNTVFLNTDDGNGVPFLDMLEVGYFEPANET